MRTTNGGWLFDNEGTIFRSVISPNFIGMERLLKSVEKCVWYRSDIPAAQDGSPMVIVTMRAMEMVRKSGKGRRRENEFCDLFSIIFYREGTGLLHAQDSSFS